MSQDGGKEISNRHLRPNPERAVSSEDQIKGQTSRKDEQLSAATSTTSKSHGFDASMIDIRPVAHKYLFRRPRALQYTYKDETLFVGDEYGIMPGGRVPTMFDDGFERAIYDVEGVTKHREKLDLFIDLIWVGIVTNLSDIFAKIYYESDASASEAFALFFIPFLASYRVWNILRTFLDSFYMDDVLQRFFIYWMLLLAVFFGNNLVYLADVGDHDRFTSAKNVCIEVYLVYRASFMLMEAIYSYWIPWLRRLTFISWIIILPSSALWIGALFIDGSNALGPIIVAIVWEFNIPLFLEYPWTQRFIPSDYHKTYNPEILRSRMSSFFILSIGEGILLLLKGGPLQIGINSTSGLLAWSLLIYLLLVYLYFNKDSSKRSVSATKLKGWRFVAYMISHVPLFSSLVVMSSGVVHFITENAPVPEADASTSKLQSRASPSSSTVPKGEGNIYAGRAIWSVAICLGIIVATMWIQALLDKSLDPRGTLLVSNRHVRLIMRPIFIVIVVSIPAAKGLNSWAFLGIAALLLLAMSVYEKIASLESPAKLMEPKGLTVVMRPLSGSKNSEEREKVVH